MKGREIAGMGKGGHMESGKAVFWGRNCRVKKNSG